MKLTIDRDKILPMLSLVSSVVEKRQTLPMLSNLHFELANGTLRTVGTDLEVEITETVEDVKGEDGALTLSMQKFYDIARMLPEDAVINIKQDKKDTAQITSGRSRYTLKTLPAKEFPRIETEDWQERFKIQQNVLKALLDKTSVAMGVNDVRYYLNGVLLHLSAKQLRATATDGHRLAQSDVDIKLGIKGTRELIVPRKAVLEINRFLGEGEGELTLEMNENHLKLSKAGGVLITKLIDGKFPEFKDVMSKEYEICVRVNRIELIEVLNRVAVLTNPGERFRGAKINLQENLMSISANNMEQEEAVEELQLEYSGAAIEVGYNIGYLVDAARVAESDELDVHLQGNDGMCVLKQPGDESTTWLVMPMRI